MNKNPRTRDGARKRIRCPVGTHFYVDHPFEREFIVQMRGHVQPVADGLERGRQPVLGGNILRTADRRSRSQYEQADDGVRHADRVSTSERRSKRTIQQTRVHYWYTYMYISLPMFCSPVHAAFVSINSYNTRTARDQHGDSAHQSHIQIIHIIYIVCIHFFVTLIISIYY